MAPEEQQEEDPAAPESSSLLHSSDPTNSGADVESPEAETSLPSQLPLPVGETPRAKNDDAGEEASEGDPSSFFFMGSVANLCSATLGAGVLSLPYALFEAGLLGGTVLLGMAAWASIVSIKFLVEASDVYDKYTYESLVERVLGHKARLVVEVSMVVFCGGCAVAYVMAVGDILQQVVPELSRKVSLCLVWAIAMLPLSLLTRMESLQWASGVGVSSIIVLVVAVLVHYIQDLSKHHPTDLYGLLWPESGVLSLVRACPMVIFAFSCQVNVCAIYHELPEVQDKPRLMANVTRTSVLGCAVLYATISTFALLDFTASVQPNILVNYCPRGIMHVAFGCMALAVVMAFPLNVFPARVAIEGMMSKSNNNNSLDGIAETNRLQEPLLLAGAEEPDECTSVDENGNDGHSGNVPLFEFDLCRHVSLTLGIAGTALGLALVVPDISIVFGLLGGTTSSALGFVIPGLLGKTVHSNGSQSIQAWILIVGGTLVGILTTGVTLWGTFAHRQSSQPVPDACHEPTMLTSVIQKDAAVA